MAPSPASSTTATEPSANLLPSQEHQEFVLNPEIEPYSQSVEKFTRFPKLPIELRLKIWKLALPARIVAIYFDEKSKEVKSTARIPAALHICKESRFESLKVYELTFGYLQKSGKVYFNPSTDILLYECICGHQEMGVDPLIMHISGLESVQYIAGVCGTSCYCICQYVEFEWVETQKIKLPSIKEIFVADACSHLSCQDLRVSDMDGHIANGMCLLDSNEIAQKAWGVQVRQIVFEGYAMSNDPQTLS